MADYDWGKSCCGQMFGHTRECYSHPSYANRKLAEKYNMTPVWDYNDTTGAQRITHYLCKSGCGCLVFDPEAHRKNVCPE